MKWYVLHVRTGKEDEIKRELQRQGYTASAPIEIMTERVKGKWTDRLKPALPGYVFAQLDLTAEDYYKMTDIPGVIRFLGATHPEPLLEDEEAFIFWLDNAGAPLAASDILLQPGQPASILSGPLKGREGLIVWINRRQRRVGVAIAMGGNRREFTLSINVLKPPKKE